MEKDQIIQNVFDMLLSGDLLFKFGYFIYEEDAGEITEPADAFDTYYLVGLQPNSKSDISSKDAYSDRIYGTTYVYNTSAAYKDIDWRKELVYRFKEVIGEESWRNVVELANHYIWSEKRYNSISHPYCTMGNDINPFNKNE